MNKLFMLGTGTAGVTKSFNTCFTIFDGTEHILIDTGGGNGILSQLEKANIQINDIHHIFISHAHIDHFFGLLWIIRKVAILMCNNKYDKKLYIYSSKEVELLVKDIFYKTFRKKLLELMDSKILFRNIENNKKIQILDYKFNFFDIQSSIKEQYGFLLEDKNGVKLTFCGDEPYKGYKKELIDNSDYLIIESFCLFSEVDKFKPYDRGHCTVKEACETAKKLNVKNLILVHTEETHKDKNILYKREAQEYFDNNVFVPLDLDIIELN